MNDEITIQVQRFDIKSMDVNSKVVVIGKPGTGKSTIIKDLLHVHRKRLPMGIVMSGTEESNDFYSGMIPDTYIYGDYNQDAINRLVARQRKMKRHKKDNANAFLVLDDCMDDKGWIKQKTTKGIFKNGRHWDLFYILAMQYCVDIPPELRTCIDYVFICKENVISNKEKLWKFYAGIFPTYDMFAKVMDSCTENYECMVIRNRAKKGEPPSNKIEDIVFWYKAKVHSPFKLGCPSYWGYHKAVYNKHYLSDEDEDILDGLDSKKLPMTKIRSKNNELNKLAGPNNNKRRFVSNKKGQPDLVIQKC